MAGQNGHVLEQSKSEGRPPEQSCMLGSRTTTTTTTKPAMQASGHLLAPATHATGQRPACSSNASDWPPASHVPAGNACDWPTAGLPAMQSTGHLLATRQPAMQATGQLLAKRQAALQALPTASRVPAGRSLANAEASNIASMLRKVGTNKTTTLTNMTTRMRNMTTTITNMKTESEVM